MARAGTGAGTIARRGALALLWLVGAAWGLAAHAGALQVSPVGLSLPADRPAQGLTLSNTGTTVVHAQVRVFAWHQAGGADQLEPAQDVVISPPMLEIPAGGSQLIRVIRTGPAPQAAEASYRVLVDELPVPATDPAAAAPGLRFVLRYSIPVFAQPVGDSVAHPVLHAAVRRVADAQVCEISNSGTGHAQVADLALIDRAGQRHAVAPGLAGYVLPGQTRSWALPAADPAGGALTARINGEADERTLALDGPAR